MIEISIIIPVYNDPKGLKDTLSSLVIQNFPKDEYEVIVADNDSADETLNVAKKYSNKHPGLIKYVVEDQIQSSYAARNKAIKVAKGKLISFIDADMTVKSNWIKKIKSVFQNVDCEYLGCKVHLYSTKHSFASLYNILNGFNVGSRMNKDQYAPTCCLTVRKEVFEKIGLFDSRFKGGADSEFGKRAFAAGINFHYEPGIIMLHPARGTISKLLKKSLRIGRSRAETSSVFPERFGYNRQRYMLVRYYLPHNPWKIKKKYKCGYSLKFITVIKLSLFPVVSQVVSLVTFFLSKLKFLWFKSI